MSVIIRSRIAPYRKTHLEWYNYVGDDTPRQRKKSHRIDQPVIEDEDTVKSKSK